LPKISAGAGAVGLAAKIAGWRKKTRFQAKHQNIAKSPKCSSYQQFMENYDIIKRNYDIFDNLNE